jgi:multidrug transporter EmrE-like cation transporter
MKQTTFLLVLVSAVLTMGANLLMRHGLLAVGGLNIGADGIRGLFERLVTSAAFMTGVIFYGAAAIVWFKVLSIAEVSTSYPILVGLTFTLVTVGAVLFFNETINPLKVAGIVVILAGIIMISRA